MKRDNFTIVRQRHNGRIQNTYWSVKLQRWFAALEISDTNNTNPCNVRHRLKTHGTDATLLHYGIIKPEGVILAGERETKCVGCGEYKRCWLMHDVNSVKCTGRIEETQARRYTGGHDAAPAKRLIINEY